MDERLRERLVEYVHAMEDATCGEYHGDDWPACPDDRHQEGRTLLTLLGHGPGTGPPRLTLAGGPICDVLPSEEDLRIAREAGIPQMIPNPEFESSWDGWATEEEER